MAANDVRASTTPLIEKRSIDYIPQAERHGRLLSQFTLWLGANLQITAIVTGALAVVLGGDVFWSLIGLLIGQLLGGGVMALHAAQGPQLGLPQMISSRVQFGVYGAAIPIVLVCLMYLGFTATGTVLSGQALGQLFGVSGSAGILIFASVIVLVTVLGYRVIHFIGRVASVVGVIAFVYLFTRLMVQADIGALLQIRHFSWSSFLLAVSLAASWQIAFGPYVADYSRYLPSATSAVKTFLAAGAGSVIGAQVAMTLGVFAAAMANGKFAGHEVAYIVGLAGSGATAALLYFSIAFGKVTISTLNSYGSFMCIATIISGFRGHLRVSRLQRLVFVLVIVGTATLIALLGQHSFLGAFKSFILFLLAFFTPWSAINLVDYYCITRERYDIPALADPHGRYGRWNLLGISVYVFGVLVQLPFISTKFYTGPLVGALGGGGYLLDHRPDSARRALLRVCKKIPRQHARSAGSAGRAGQRCTNCNKRGRSRCGAGLTGSGQGRTPFDCRNPFHDWERHTMKMHKTLLASLFSAGLLASVGAQAAGWCESGKPVKFAGLNWESGMLLTDILQTVLEKGYDCKTDSLPGNSITMENALGSNDIQVFAEEWVGRSEVWNKAEKAGKVVGVGAPVVGAVEGWYVPRYVIEGDAKRKLEAKAPDLKSIADLGRYASVFKDQEEPSKGRFYNCPAGWTCELDNSEMLKRYGLQSTYTNFRPGTGPALDAAVLSSYKRGEPILFYYWSPTPLMGQVDLVKLEENPGVDKNISIKVGLSKTFHEQAPELVAVLEKVNLPIDLLNQNLGRMAKQRIESPKLAKIFLKEHPEVWHAWVSDDAAKKIDAAL